MKTIKQIGTSLKPMAVLVASIITSGGAWALTYSITDLGTLGGSTSVATSINNNGDIAGYAALNGDTAQHAFIYSGGVMTDIGTLGGTRSIAMGINNYGEVAGFSQITGDTTYHAFLYGSSMSDLGTLGGVLSFGTGINDSGVTTGYAWTTGNGSHLAFRYSSSSMNNLGTLGGSNSEGRAINNSGQVVGSAELAGSPAVQHAFLYSGGAMTDIHDPFSSYISSNAVAINDSGAVAANEWNVGISDNHAFLYQGGVKTYLGVLGGTYSKAYGINNNGQIVGVSSTSTVQHGFLYSGGVMQDLEAMLPSGSGWTALNPNDINDSGQIVGEGYIDGQHRAFLMEPGC
jgi:probable HAF family extracellular repeat protein